VLTLYDSILPPRYRSWYNIWHKVPPRGKKQYKYMVTGNYPLINEWCGHVMLTLPENMV
jgi:hypothetical protein